MAIIPKQTAKLAPLHFRRMELKYYFPERYVQRFIEAISPYTEPDPWLRLEGVGRTTYPVTSLYFDSYDLQSLREKDAGALARRKLRLRTYDYEFSENTTAFLEIKRRHDFIVSKDRLSLSVGHIKEEERMGRLLGHLMNRVEASEAVTAEAQTLRSWFSLQPTAIVTYDRIPFVANHDSKFRITIDHSLRGVWRPTKLLGEIPSRSCMSGYCIVEVKCDYAVPSWFHRIIQEFEMMRTAYSKYAMVVASLEPFAISQNHVLSRYHSFN